MISVLWPILSKFWWAPIVAATIALTFVQTKRLDHSKADLAQARGQVVSVTAAFHEAETIRTAERAADQTAFDTAQASCDARLVASLQSGRTIERIINAPAPINGAPRGSVDADSLRLVFGGAGPASQTAGVQR